MRNYQPTYTPEAPSPEPPNIVAFPIPCPASPHSGSVNTMQFLEIAAVAAFPTESESESSHGMFTDPAVPPSQLSSPMSANHASTGSMLAVPSGGFWVTLEKLMAVLL
jgi:hypothetical protein